MQSIGIFVSDSHSSSQRTPRSISVKGKEVLSLLVHVMQDAAE